MKEQSIPLLKTADKELAQIAAALEIPESPALDFEGSLAWRLSLPHVCIAAIGAFLFGYHSGVLNATLQFIARDLGFFDNDFAQGSVVSICLVGGLFGCICSGTIADEFGRRRAVQLSTAPIILGCCVSAVAWSIKFMMLGRFLVGLGLGIGSSATTLYVSEISPAPLRGTYGAICQIAGCIGLLVSFAMGLPVAIINGWWRICFWMPLIPAVILLLAFESCPESPRWLYKHSQWSEAETAIKRLWGPANFAVAVADLVQGEKPESVSYVDLCNKETAKVVLKGASIFIFQQFSGIGAIVFFSSTLFRNAGLKSDLAASVCIGFVNLIASSIATCLIDKVGRKTLLMWSFSGMSLGMSIQACATALPASSIGKIYVLLFGTVFHVFMYAMGVGPVPMALLPEMFPNRIRAKAMAFSLSILWITTGLVGMLYLPMLKKFGDLFLFSFFAFVGLLGTLFVRECITETKGRSLEEIEASLFSVAKQ
ncbi:hypothetical protein KP509_34G003000 [Ceratopteris richardii]|uniref:Major facilitator superfamily (MFS) profile domain-containing protein n=1 Tax=Ceratopteris richardii TaxID=49495 RepID=A0A8T2QHY7_CERRI|nr:hypothetical protein KP509_34G003000 [Ceratopteris richardii]